MQTKPWVKTSLAPGSRVVIDYLDRAGLIAVPRRAGLQPGRLRLHHLHRQLRAAARRGQRRDRRRTTCRWPRCCRATATSRRASTRRCGPTTWPRRRWWSPTRWPARVTIDLTTEPLGSDRDGKPVMLERALADLRRGRAGHGRAPSRRAVRRPSTAGSSTATSAGASCRCRPASCSHWDPDSTYVREATFFERPADLSDIVDARVLAMLGDSVTTDHISPAGVDRVVQPRPAGTWSSTASSRASSTATAPAAATTR